MVGSFKDLTHKEEFKINLVTADLSEHTSYVLIILFTLESFFGITERGIKFKLHLSRRGKVSVKLEAKRAASEKLH